VIYRSNASSVKTLIFLQKIEEKYREIPMDPRKPQNIITILNKTKGMTLLFPKYTRKRVIGIKTLWCRHKKEYTDQWNTIGSPQNNSIHFY
jgi:hypothetical protein